MKIFAPDYYNDFKCIAGACRHNCCIGWEIDIDPDTYEYYLSLSGDFAERLKSNISFDGETACFLLTGSEERCPFLNENNLCDIILEAGENSLCQICTDHPRFRNFFSDRAETGLGLCCEEACRIILSKKDKTRIVLISDDKEIDEEPDETEQYFLNFRSRLFDTVRNREKTIDERINDMLKMCCSTLPEKSLSEWADIYLGLEHLDEEWVLKLKSLKGDNKQSFRTDTDSETALEQLLVYFLYRHLSPYGNIPALTAFAALSVYIIRSLSSGELNNLAEVTRMYSSEIEYSDENMELLLELL